MYTVGKPGFRRLLNILEPRYTPCSYSFLIMNELWQSGQFCDVTFKIKTQKIFAHQIVVATISSYFRALLTCGMKESSREEMEIYNIQPQAMLSIIDYPLCRESHCHRKASS